MSKFSIVDSDFVIYTDEIEGKNTLKIRIPETEMDAQIVSLGQDYLLCLAEDTEMILFMQNDEATRAVMDAIKLREQELSNNFSNVSTWEIKDFVEQNGELSVAFSKDLNSSNNSSDFNTENIFVEKVDDSYYIYGKDKSGHCVTAEVQEDVGERRAILLDSIIKEQGEQTIEDFLKRDFSIQGIQDNIVILVDNNSQSLFNVDNFSIEKIGDDYYFTASKFNDYIVNIKLDENNLLILKENSVVKEALDKEDFSKFNSRDNFIDIEKEQSYTLIQSKDNFYIKENDSDSKFVKVEGVLRDANDIYFITIENNHFKFVSSEICFDKAGKEFNVNEINKFAEILEHKDRHIVNNFSDLSLNVEGVLKIDAKNYFDTSNLNGQDIFTIQNVRVFENEKILIADLIENGETKSVIITDVMFDRDERNIISGNINGEQKYLFVESIENGKTIKDIENVFNLSKIENEFSSLRDVHFYKDISNKNAEIISCIGLNENGEQVKLILDKLSIVDLESGIIVHDGQIYRMNDIVMQSGKIEYDFNDDKIVKLKVENELFYNFEGKEENGIRISFLNENVIPSVSVDYSFIDLDKQLLFDKNGNMFRIDTDGFDFKGQIILTRNEAIKINENFSSGILLNLENNNDLNALNDKIFEVTRQDYENHKINDWQMKVVDDKVVVTGYTYNIENERVEVALMIKNLEYDRFSKEALISIDDGQGGIKKLELGEFNESMANRLAAYNNDISFVYRNMKAEADRYISSGSERINNYEYQYQIDGLFKERALREVFEQEGAMFKLEGDNRIFIVSGKDVVDLNTGERGSFSEMIRGENIEIAILLSSQAQSDMFTYLDNIDEKLKLEGKVNIDINEQGTVIINTEFEEKRFLADRILEEKSAFIETDTSKLYSEEDIKKIQEQMLKDIEKSKIEAQEALEKSQQERNDFSEDIKKYIEDTKERIIHLANEEGADRRSIVLITQELSAIKMLSSIDESKISFSDKKIILDDLKEITDRKLDSFESYISKLSDFKVNIEEFNSVKGENKEYKNVDFKNILTGIEKNLEGKCFDSISVGDIVLKEDKLLRKIELLSSEIENLPNDDLSKKQMKTILDFLERVEITEMSVDIVKFNDSIKDIDSFNEAFSQLTGDLDKYIDSLKGPEATLLIERIIEDGNKELSSLENIIKDVENYDAKIEAIKEEIKDAAIERDVLDFE